MNEAPIDMFHPFIHPVSDIPLPKRFTYPFHYTPHPLCVIAAGEVQSYLEKQIQWTEELRGGKMFGVLVVRDRAGTIGFLAAFSGNLAGKNSYPFFVPPIYDLLRPDGFFCIEEDKISAINAHIREQETNPSYLLAQEKLVQETLFAEQSLASAKKRMKDAKEEREIRRQGNPNEEEQAIMIRESQFQKAELKRLERSLKERIESLRLEINAFSSEIERLRQERKKRSAALQHQLFTQFRIVNAKGEIKDLGEIFAPTPQKTPPAGAGECAAPKLLQHAYLHQYTPIAMAEFWWGDSPKTELRRHGYYYPACKGKCEPILGHMLQGLEVDPNPLTIDAHKEMKLDILFEDAWILVINKSAGMLSVPGKGEVESVYQRLRRLYPEATGPMIVHRLDMATSGVLLIAKTKETHQNLQAQFKNRTIKKRYIAILDGQIPERQGMINLPLCPDPTDRPRQIVSEEYGKPAITRYEKQRESQGKTEIAFYPLTGRTHQLRVHSAHPDGLDCPILGDELYGKKANRLYLHAERLEFTHPVSGETICVSSPCPFILPDDQENHARNTPDNTPP